MQICRICFRGAEEFTIPRPGGNRAAAHSSSNIILPREGCVSKVDPVELHIPSTEIVTILTYEVRASSIGRRNTLA